MPLLFQVGSLTYLDVLIPSLFVSNRFYVNSENYYKILMEALKTIEQLRQLDIPLNNYTSHYKICSIILFIYVKILFTKDFTPLSILTL